MKTLENLINDAGGCGRFQVIQVLAITGVRLVAMWGLMIMAFGNYNPGWRCFNGANLTAVVPNSQLLGNLSKYYPTRDSLDGLRSWSERFDLRERNDSVFPGGKEEDSQLRDVEGKDLNASAKDDGFDTECQAFDNCPDVRFQTGTKTIVTEWGLACRHTWMVSLTISIQMAGLFFGCAIAGHISERWGRRKALYGNAIVYSAACLVASFSTSWAMYTSCLFFLGIGAGGVLTVALVYCFEFLEPRWRAILGGLPLANLSQTAFSLMVFLERDWRHLHITIAAFAGIIICLTIFWVPESMRWLAVHGRLKEAKGVIDKIARSNGRRCDGEEVMASLVAMGEDHDGNQHKFSYLDLFTEKSLRWMTIKLALIWICEVTVYFALTFAVKIFSGNFYLNLFIYSSVEIPVVIFIGPLANLIGRKRCGVIMFFLSTVTCIGVAVIKFVTTKNSPNALAILILATLTKSFISGGRCVVTIVTGELPPTVVRNLTYGFCMLFSRLGCIIAPYLVPDQSTLHISFTIMACLLFLTAALFMTLPETRQRPMDDVLELDRSRRVQVCPDKRSDCDVNQDGGQRSSQNSQRPEGAETTTPGISRATV